MSQMIITDLSFCENTGTNAQEIKGGFISSSLDTGLATAFSPTLKIKKSNNGYLISYGVNVAVAAGVAAAVSDGTTYTSVNVFTRVG